MLPFAPALGAPGRMPLPGPPALFYLGCLLCSMLVVLYIWVFSVSMAVVSSIMGTYANGPYTDQGNANTALCDLLDTWRYVFIGGRALIELER